MPVSSLEPTELSELFSRINTELTKKKLALVSGLPTLTSQSYVITRNPLWQSRIIFWLLKTEEISPAQKLLGYWHTVQKQQKLIWSLDSINPLRAQNLLNHLPQIILVDIATLGNRFPTLNNHQDHLLEIKTGQRLNPADLSQKLVEYSYDFTNQASQAGYFSRRGGLVDIFPMNSEKPFRCEFEDNQLVSIRAFNPVNKRLEENNESITVIAQRFPSSHHRAALTSYLDVINSPLIIYHDREELSAEQPAWVPFEKKIQSFERMVIHDFSKEATNLGFEHAPLYYSNFDKFIGDITGWRKKNWQISIATNKQKELKTLFKEKNTGDLKLNLIPSLPELAGFKDTETRTLLLTDKEIYGEQNAKHESARYRVDQAFIMELKPGDYVVHLDHGIGKFAQMTNNVVDNINREYFVLQYAEGDKLYVPVETADKISKYIGLANPKLHRLSGGQWYQLTRKVKMEAKVLAQELLKIYAKRELIKIKPFTHDTPEDRELAKTFPYQETPDQSKAITDVKHDLEKETPMDRLICGDVGFGKTEVAVRAAFKAVMNKKQVALLSPTTILTQQHYDTFRERLKKFSVNVGVLSRFESDKEQLDTIEKLKSGLIDIVVGTHRLLSTDVAFKNLGLIIIDEEQRFGVKAKEKLKTMRAHAHILTLTATPIPRTLNIALSGVRDVSVIETPPEGRLPIETYIEPHSDEIVKKAIGEELKRDGQVYYLYNKVETINFMAKQLQDMFPKSRIGVAHGRLPEKDLAAAMEDFDTRKTNILVCSTIIENGLDLPNVNTMIVDNATNFGLAQLYQLRGRIGRGQRQAYSYFLYHRKKLKGNARKRLQALMEAKKLGSGFQLALRDLEIRGAGNILGKEQHGKVSAIGLSLYTRLLAQAIEELKYGKVQEPVRDILIDLPLESYIPKEFLAEEERLLLYQKMASIMNIENLNELKEKIIRSRTKEEQRTIPKQLLNLFEVLEIRILAQKTDISHIDTTIMTEHTGEKKRKLLLKFIFPLKAEKLAKLLQKESRWQFTDDTIKINFDILGDKWVEELKKVIRIFQN